MYPAGIGGSPRVATAVGQLDAIACCAAASGACPERIAEHTYASTRSFELWTNELGPPSSARKSFFGGGIYPSSALVTTPCCKTLGTRPAPAGQDGSANGFRKRQLHRRGRRDKRQLR